MLEGLEPPVKNTLCLIGRKAAELSDSDLQILEASLADPRWTTSSLTRALAERGFVVGETALRKHSKRECACVRTP